MLTYHGEYNVSRLDYRLEVRDRAGALGLERITF